MPVCFHGASGRTDATLAALLLARGLAAAMPTRLVRIALPDEPMLTESHSHPEALIVEQQVAESAEHARALAAGFLAKNDGRRLVLDLPLPLVEASEVRERVALAIVTFGPMPLDETAAVVAHARASRIAAPGQPSPHPVWLLGCSRTGGAPAARIVAADLAALAESATGEPVRVLPAVLPPIGHLQAYWLQNGVPDSRALALGRALANLVDRVRELPTAATMPADDDALACDDRSPEERLRSLADDLEGHRDGRWPEADVLRQAPVIENWAFATRPRKVLVGTVGPGHPTVKPGRTIVTSEVYASDGQAWARSFSRTFRLGTPAVT